MKSSLYAALAVALAGAPAWAADPTTDKEKASYAVGVDIGNNIKRSGLGDEVNLETLARGLTDALGGKKPELSEEEMTRALEGLRESLRTKAEGNQKAASEKNQKDGADFLAANAKKEGVKTTASGLQYKVLTEGKGDKPQKSDTVVTHYRGTLIDGTEFDSSYQRNEPATFPVTGVIPGWTEALQLMPVGSKWQLAIPASLAYGENAPAEIGPNQTLLFDIELLEIKK